MGEELLDGTTAALLGWRGGRWLLRGEGYAAGWERWTMVVALLGGTMAALLRGRGGRRFMRC